MEDTFEIRCFLNDVRKPTHELTKEEARNFRAAARHLAKYLTDEYQLDDETCHPE